MAKKWNVVLDLDQTIISGEDLKDFDFKGQRNRIGLFDNNQMENIYIVFGRPHLQEFLDFLFANFNVAVWTAASKSYALFVIDNFILTKPNRRLDFIFFSYHCEYSKKCKKGLKGLNVLWEDFQLKHYNAFNTIIIDDNPDVKEIQNCNCYAIKEFYMTEEGSENDTELLKLQQKLITLLKRDPVLNSCMIKNL